MGIVTNHRRRAPGALRLDPGQKARREADRCPSEQAPTIVYNAGRPRRSRSASSRNATDDRQAGRASQPAEAASSARTAVRRSVPRARTPPLAHRAVRRAGLRHGSPISEAAAHACKASQCAWNSRRASAAANWSTTAYNSDINSLALSLDYLVSVAGGQPKILILSDIRQSGLPAEKLYEQVAALLRTKRIDTLIGIGEEIVQHAASFGCDKAFYRNTDEFLRSYNRTQFVNKSILLKGGRCVPASSGSAACSRTRFTRPCWKSISTACIHNLNYFRGLLRPGERMMAMVKAVRIRQRHVRGGQPARAAGRRAFWPSLSPTRASRCARRASRCRSSC